MSKGSSRSKVYRVEARSSYFEPQAYAGQLFDQRWKTVSFAEAPPGFGVPGSKWNSSGRYGFLTYEQAQALRWWFHAIEFSACIETRLVAYDYEETWSAEEFGVSEPQEWPRRPFDDFSPRDASAGEAGTAGTTEIGPVHEHATAESGDAQTPSPSSRERK